MVTVDGGTAAAPSSVAVSGSTVTLTLATAVTAANTSVTLSYTKGTNPVQDAAGNEAVALTDESVTNSTEAPAVTVKFAAAMYSVDEGGSVDVTVTLSADPQRTVIIPITATTQGTTAGGDYSLGATSAPRSTMVIIIDDNPAVTVSFGAATYSADENDSVDVTVTLSANPMRPVTIPIIATAQGTTSTGDYTDPTSFTFPSGQTSRTLSFRVTEDTTPDHGESVQLSFGTLPPGVSASGTTTTTVSINDDDDPEVKISFGVAAYTATEGGTSTVTVTLSADPERTVVIPITTTNESGAVTTPACRRT